MIRRSLRYNALESFLALFVTFAISLALLVVSAAEFYDNDIVVTRLQQAADLLQTLDNVTASVAFGLALFLAGMASTITGTYAGWLIMHGFLKLDVALWKRRLATRCLSVIPAIVISHAMGDEGLYSLLILSQALLSFQLPFSVIPLMRFTNSIEVMGETWVNNFAVKWLALGASSVLMVSNIVFALQSIIHDVEGTVNVILALMLCFFYFLAYYLLCFSSPESFERSYATIRKFFVSLRGRRNNSSSRQQPTSTTGVIFDMSKH